MKYTIFIQRPETHYYLIATMCALFVALAAPAHAADALSLKECLAAALSHNPVITDARLGIRSAEMSVDSAQGKHWPRLTADASYIKRQDPLPFIPAQSAKIQPHFSNEFAALGLTLSLPIYQGGQVMNGVSLAQVRQDIQEQSARQTTYDIMANIVNTYNKILQLRELRAASIASVNALEEQVKNTKLLFDVGRVARVDLLKAEVQLANERQRLLSFDEGMKTALSTLVYLMGGSADGEAEPSLLADELSKRVISADLASGIVLY